jgi:uncharacterized membrane protein
MNQSQPPAPRPTAAGAGLRTATLAGATVTTGLIAGLFYAFSCAVNLGLASQPDASYVATMQAINRRIQNPVFFASFFGAACLLLLALLLALPRRHSPRFPLIALACALYLGGGILLTVVGNVPLNERLDAVASDATQDELARARAAYEGPWNAWHTARTAASTFAFIALVAACLRPDERGTE